MLVVLQAAIVEAKGGKGGKPVVNGEKNRPRFPMSPYESRKLCTILWR